MMTDATQFDELPNESAGERILLRSCTVTPRNVRDDYSMAISLQQSSLRLGSSGRARLLDGFVGEMSIHAGLS